MSAFISAILAIANAIPVVDKWVQALVASYTTARLASMKAENQDAIISAVQKFNQIPLEQAIGSPTAGKASGDAGATITDAPPPGVPIQN